MPLRACQKKKKYVKMNEDGVENNEEGMEGEGREDVSNLGSEAGPSSERTRTESDQTDPNIEHDIETASGNKKDELLEDH